MRSLTLDDLEEEEYQFLLRMGESEEEEEYQCLLPMGESEEEEYQCLLRMGESARQSGSLFDTRYQAAPHYNFTRPHTVACAYA